MSLNPNIALTRIVYRNAVVFFTVILLAAFWGFWPKYFSNLLAARGRSTFSELRWYPPMEAAKGSLSWVFRAKQPESVRTGP